MDDDARRPPVLSFIAILVCALVLSACSAPLQEPRMSPGTTQVAGQGELTSHAATFDGVERTWLTYVPNSLDGPAPVILLFHGSGDVAVGIRAWVGSYFERIADQNGAIIAYPDGFQSNWNECRAEGRWPAKERDLDDVGFGRAIVDRLERDLGAGSVDRDRVFAAGYSSGGHMAMRMGREADDLVSAIAVVAANPPIPENQACEDQTAPMPAIFIEGMRDSVNPFEGGEVRVVGPGGSRGNVMSAIDGAQSYADNNGAAGPVPVASPDRVHITEWTGDHPVRLVAVEDEAHNFPLSTIHGPNRIWEFLAAVE